MAEARAVRYFDVDGFEHRMGASCWCSVAVCPCGGPLHFQGVWGGYFEECERCGDWEGRVFYEVPRETDTWAYEDALTGTAPTP